MILCWCVSYFCWLIIVDFGRGFGLADSACALFVVVLNGLYFGFVAFWVLFVLFLGF